MLIVSMRKILYLLSDSAVRSIECTWFLRKIVAIYFKKYNYEPGFMLHTYNLKGRRVWYEIKINIQSMTS